MRKFVVAFSLCTLLLSLLTGILGVSAQTDTTPPVISNVRPENIIGPGAQIKWDTNELANSAVIYGTSPGSYPSAATGNCSGEVYVLNHCVNVTNLISHTVYYYKVKSGDQAGSLAESGENQFTSAMAQTDGGGSGATAGSSGGGTTGTGGTTTTGGDTIPPTVTQFGFFTEPDGRVRAGASFGERMNLSSFTGDTVYLIRAADGSKVRGTVHTYDYGVDFLTSDPADSSTDYQLVVKSSVKDVAGNSMVVDYFSPRFQPSAPAYYAQPTNATTSATIAGSATVTGSVRNASGQPVASAWVHIFSGDFTTSIDGMTDAAGSFRLGVSPGEYFIEVFPPRDRNDLVKSAPEKFSVNGGETKSLTRTFGSASKTITGTVKFSNGQPVTDAEVGAYSQTSGQWTSVFTDTLGNFTMSVGPGRWTVDFHPRDPLTARWGFTGTFQEIEFREDTFAEAKTLQVVVHMADAKAVVQTVDEKGVPLANVGVVLDTVRATETSLGSKPPSEFRNTDTSGYTTFLVIPGKYYLRAFLPSELGLINPEETAVELAAGERQVKLVFRRPESIARTTLQGRALRDDGTPIDAFVWVWSERGRSFETRASASGEFTISLPTNDRYYVSAGQEVANFPYQSTRILVEVKDVPVAVILLLAKFGEEPLPPSLEVKKAASEQVIVQVEDGASVIVPPYAATSQGTVSVELTPTVEAPPQPAAHVVSTVYDITITDQGGNTVTQLQEAAEIRLPYREEDLKAQGVTEDTIVPSFFDEASGSWVEVDNYTVDKENNAVIARVTHLTRFAIVAAADVTPPDAPGSAKVVAGGSGVVVISWVNPTKDFDHVKMYRATSTNLLGEVVANDVAGTEYKDTNVKDGVIYYYTVRAVDPAGNESTNTLQVSALAVGTGVKPLPPPGQATKLEILRNLTVGSSGDDVKTLQELLVKDGVYPEGLITGFFGDLTKQAVIRFQEKYASEILAPSGLTKGPGNVGPATRKKANELLGASSKVQPAVPPGQAMKAEILRDLTVGSRGEDVSVLQELLLQEGVYPEGLITGFFGSLTKTAVIRFQEKYASEILAPNGFVKGTGYVGPATRAKINTLSK